MNQMKTLIIRLAVRLKPFEEDPEALPLHLRHLGIIHHRGTENEITALVEGLIVKGALHLYVVALIEPRHHVGVAVAVSMVVAFHLAGEIAVWSGDMTEEVGQEIDMSAAVDVIGALLHVGDEDPGYRENGACPLEETTACHQDVTEVYLTGMKVTCLYFTYFYFPALFSYIHV